MARLQDKYYQEIVEKLKQKLGRTNALSLPRLQKIVVNMGVGKALQDKNRMEQAAEQLTNIAGQKCADARCSSASDHNHLDVNTVFFVDAFLFGHPQSAVKRADRAEPDADFVLRGRLKTA